MQNEVTNAVPQSVPSEAPNVAQNLGNVASETIGSTREAVMET